MKTRLKDYSVTDKAISSQRLLEGLQRSLDASYQELFAAAKSEWERSYTGNDPSDACVSVRIGAEEGKIRKSFAGVWWYGTEESAFPEAPQDFSLAQPR